MRWCWLVLLALVAGCGGGDDRASFVSEVNAACREYQRAADADRPPDDMGEAYTAALEEEIERLRDIEPPDADRARYEEMVRHQEEGLASWKELVRYREAADYDATELASTRATKSLVTAARIAGDLGLDDCDRALS
jgi:hypothetical protein